MPLGVLGPVCRVALRWRGRLAPGEPLESSGADFQPPLLLATLLPTPPDCSPCGPLSGSPASCPLHQPSVLSPGTWDLVPHLSILCELGVKSKCPSSMHVTADTCLPLLPCPLPASPPRPMLKNPGLPELFPFRLCQPCPPQPQPSHRALSPTPSLWTGSPTPALVLLESGHHIYYPGSQRGDARFQERRALPFAPAPLAPSRCQAKPRH